MLTTKNIIKRPIAMLTLSLIKSAKAHGKIIIPEPIKGIASKAEIIAAVPIGFLSLITVFYQVNNF